MPKSQFKVIIHLLANVRVLKRVKGTILLELRSMISRAVRRSILMARKDHLMERIGRKCFILLKRYQFRTIWTKSSSKIRTVLTIELLIILNIIIIVLDIILLINGRVRKYQWIQQDWLNRTKASLHLWINRNRSTNRN